MVTEPKTKNSVRKVALSPAGRRPAGAGARTAPGQPHPVPVAPDGRLLEPGRRVKDQPQAAEKGRHRGARALPRSQTHIRHHGHLQRCGCKDPVQYAGPLQRRVHPGHLHAHHQRYAERRGGEDRRLHGIGHGQRPTPEPPDPPEQSRCKVIPFEKVG